MFVVGGESLIDLVSAPRGPGETIIMQAHQGGSPYNCSIALARLGKDTGFLCPISRDGFGSYLLEPLETAGVRPLLAERVAAPTTLAAVTLDAEGKAQYEFYRGADRALSAETGLAALPETLDLYQIGGFCPIEPDDAVVWRQVIEAAIDRGATISFDPNVRPSLLADPEGYRQRLETFLDLAHILKLSEEDMAWLDPGLSIAEHARSLLARRNCRLVVVTLGAEGSRAFTEAGEVRAGIYAPPVFGDTVGAGDSLMAGLLCWLADNDALAPDRLGALGADRLSHMLRFGAVVAGLNCAEIGCKPPTREAVDKVLAET